MEPKNRREEKSNSNSNNNRVDYKKKGDPIKKSGAVKEKKRKRVNLDLYPF